jgi:zona occludens toxin (predicted ATPase)
VTLSVNDTQSKNALHYAKCHVLFIVMLNVIMLSVVSFSVVASFLAASNADNASNSAP